MTVAAAGLPVNIGRTVGFLRVVREGKRIGAFTKSSHEDHVLSLRRATREGLLGPASNWTVTPFRKGGHHL